jgi:hypothetical protein
MLYTDDDDLEDGSYRRLMIEDLYSGLNPKGPPPGNVNNLIFILKSCVKTEQKTQEKELKNLQCNLNIIKREISLRKSVIKRGKKVLDILEKTKSSPSNKK